MEAFTKSAEDQKIDEDVMALGHFDLWTLFADRMRMPRHKAKRLAYEVMFGLEFDPWICHIVRTELEALTRISESDGWTVCDQWTIQK